MWGGFVNENSPAGVGLLRKICQHKLGRGPVSACSGMVEALCNIARSSDDWQYMMATECLWLLQDPNTSHKVVDKAVPTLMDLAELTDLRDHKKLGDSIKERVVLYSNRAQCHLLLQQPLVTISDAGRAVSLHSPVNRHAKSLWRRAQAYDMLGLAKESLLDAILFINECSQSNDPDFSMRQNKVPDYAERLVKKQMRAAWLFREAALKHGGARRKGEEREVYGNESDDSEWETASGSDTGDDGRDHMGLDDEEEEKEEGHGEKWKKRDKSSDKNEKTCSKGMRHGYSIKLAEEDL
ncbi:hypothetical protein Bca52824_021458 [Brassica carinata]|uniref:Uncharacterized protein n=1 Tax=Brassica carinata TaxID=52824 RepID=A0A8X7VEM3_BRACI|nr:hypothetical protein Bca52824_021458 [Brassica carinata]